MTSLFLFVSMRVLLIQPPYPLAEFPKPSLALMSLGAVLRRQGVEVEVLDLLSCRFSWGKIEARMDRFRPRAIGVTSVTMNFPTAVSILQHCKRLMPEAVTMMGGPHVTFTAEETLARFPGVDLIVRGEGEETLGELLEALDRPGAWGQIRGITFRRDGELFSTPDRPLIADLDRLPFPERDLFPLSRYLALGVPASVLSSRGCPAGCSFCVGFRMTGRPARYRNPHRVVDEIAAAAGLGFSSVCIDDDLFTRNRRHVSAVCAGIEARGLALKLYVFARVDTVDRELLRLLRRAGCEMICFGLESGNQDILNRVHKKATLEAARRAVELTREEGITAFGSFILGLPGETPETMEETIRFARDLQTPYGFHLLSPFPGTQVRDEAGRLGLRILTDDWRLYDANHAVTETADLPASVVQEFTDRFNRNLERQIQDLKQEVLAGTYSGPYLQELEHRLEADFVWKLLENDIVEQQGGAVGVSGAAALEIFSARVSEAVSFPPKFTADKLGKFTERGYLVLRGGRWSWRDDF